jgi:hypothetical protein
MSQWRAAAWIALAAAAACRPTARGLCAQDADCRTGAMCTPEGICVGLPPLLTVSVQTPPDAGGWFSRAGADLEIAAQVTRDGTDPVSAVLTFADCAATACSFQGTPVPGGFTFRVPRQVQAAGSAALLSFKVVVTDRAEHQGEASGILKIDDAAPVIGSFSPVSAGTIGEDGKSWFGGPGAPVVEIAVPVSDPGAGVASVALHVDPADVVTGTALNPPAIPSPDGTVHFELPASGMRGQGPMHFSLVATDPFGNSASIPVSSVLVDAAGPAVTPPRVSYGSAQPSGVCDLLATCGRNATHLLRDDTAELTFDVTDCGVGTASASVMVANGKTVAAVETGASGSSCANGNQTHHFKATVNFADAAPLLPPSDSSGTVPLRVTASAADLVQNTGTGAAPAAATSGDGIAVISLWRWKQQLADGAATGSPVLLAASGGAGVAIGSANAVTALTPNGAQAWRKAVTAGVGSDLAIGPSGKIYAVSPAMSCSGSCKGTLTIVTAAGDPVACLNEADDVSFGAPPAVTTGAGGAEVAIVIATDRRGLPALDNVFVYRGGCGPTRSSYSPASGELTGISAMPGRVFVSSPVGFTSLDQNPNDDKFNSLGNASYTPQTNANAPAPPSLVALPPFNATLAIFGTTSGDGHRAEFTPAGSPNCADPVGCWQDTYASPPPRATAPISSMPVFDGTHVYVTDDSGTVSSWVQSTGVVDWTKTLGGTASAPVILDDAAGLVLVVQNDGSLKLVSETSVTPLLKVAAYGGVPPVPAIEVSGSYGVAYVPDGAGWVWAVNLPVPPMQASSVAWPRPGRDSCNSRSAGTPCP